MTKKQRIIADKLKAKFGVDDATAKAFSKELLQAIKPAPGAPGSYQADDTPPDDGDDSGGHAKGPGRS